MAAKAATRCASRRIARGEALAFIAEGKDDALHHCGITSLEQTLRKAQARFNQWLRQDDPDRTFASLLETLNFDYFKLLDLLTIARSRNPCRLLSRELLYTALTRQKERVVILHQGDRASLKTFATDQFSESARRMTNLLAAPMPVMWRDRVFDERLIHLTSRGEFVRSKSEVIIANHLHHPPDLLPPIDYVYEQPLTLGEETRYPDFTIEDEESGITYYWEHCGMLHVPEYENRWKKKLNWYREHDILPYEEGGGGAGTLIITRDSERGAIASPEIERIIREVVIG